MKWCIDFQPDLPSFSLSTDAKIYLAGSCFAWEWAQKFQSLQWPANYHPFHITYQPQALLSQLEFVLDRREWAPEHWVEVQGRWRHLNAHSRLSHADKSTARAFMDTAREQARTALLTSDTFIITLGSAHSYTYLPTAQKVANCQKLPQSLFTSDLESVSAIENQVFKIQEILQTLPNFRRAVWTVSPVRHLRMGIIENQRSKARLLLAVESLTNQKSGSCYFPAYEWLIDVLRDYRFYSSDLAHPSAEAADYILKKFTETYFSPEAKCMLKELEAYAKLRHHKSTPEMANLHEKKRQEMRLALEQTYPNLVLD